MTSRLFALLAREWERFDGEQASQGKDPLHDLPADRFLSLGYWWATHNASEQADVDRFDRKLWMPPKGVAAAPGSPWSPEAETAAFGSLAAAFGVGVAGQGVREGAEAPSAP